MEGDGREIYRRSLEVRLYRCQAVWFLSPLKTHSTELRRPAAAREERLVPFSYINYKEKGICAQNHGLS